MTNDMIQMIVVFSSVILFTALIVHFKLKKRELDTRGNSAELGEEVDALRDDLDDTRAQLAKMQEHTRAQLAEMQERLDFAERMLTAGRASLKDGSG